MIITKVEERPVIIEDGKVNFCGVILSDDEMLKRKYFELIKLKQVSLGKYYSAYVIDELEMYCKNHIHAYEHFFFMLEVITELVIRRGAIIEISALIHYMMKDIDAFKMRYYASKSLTLLISEIYTECEMIL